MSSVIDKIKATMPTSQPPVFLQPTVVSNQEGDVNYENTAPKYKLKDAVLKNDLKQAQINQNQLEMFNELKQQAFDKISALSSMNCLNNIDNLILMIMAAAEYSIQQTKIGDYRLQLTMNAIFEYYLSKNIIFDESGKIITAKLVTEIFNNNRKKLLKLFSDMFDVGSEARKLWKKC